MHARPGGMGLALMAALVLQAGVGAGVGVDFSLPTAISPGNLNPGGHLVGDLNADGHLDVVYSTGGAPFTFPVRSLLADGRGDYADGLAIASTGVGVLQALADLNGDERADLVVRNVFGGATLWVRLSQGDGTFSGGHSLGTTTDADLAWLEYARPASLRAGELPDLVYVTRGDSGTGVPPRLRVLRNDGAAFVFADSHDVPASVRHLLVADFDADGLDDVAASFADGSLRVFVADGAGGLDPSASLNVGNFAGVMASADVDADGRLDLFVAADTTTVVKRLLGAGDGSFSPPTTIAGTGAVVGLSVADADGDGAPDLVTNRHLGGLPPNATSQLEVHRGFCDGSFTAPVVLTDADQFFGGPSVADMDEDGLNDLVTVPDNEFVAVLFNEVLAPTYANVGGGLAGTPVGGAAASTLDARGALIGGEPFRWTLVDALPSAPAYFVLGVTAISAPFKGGTFVPMPNLLVGPLSVDADGRLGLGGTFPTIAGGFPLVIQYWYLDAGGPVGFAASPGVIATVP